MPVDQPVSVEPYFDQARLFVEGLAAELPLGTAFLDEWNGPSRLKTVRIIYGPSFAADCGSRCADCPLYRRVGEDDPGEDVEFSEKLSAAEDRHRALLGSDTQRFLNCKTIDQYREAFVRFMIVACTDQEEMDAELRWVYGLRLLCHPECHSTEELRDEELRFKQSIVTETLARLRASGDEERIEWVERTWKDLQDSGPR